MKVSRYGKIRFFRNLLAHYLGQTLKFSLYIENDSQVLRNGSSESKGIILNLGEKVME